MYFARKRHYILNSNLKLQTLLFPVGPSMRLRRGQGWGEWGDTGGWSSIDGSTQGTWTGRI